MKYLSLMSVCVMTALLFSCKTSETEKLDGNTEVTFQLSADGTHHKVKSDLAEDLVPDVNDFTVEVFKRQDGRRKRLYMDTYLNSTEKHIRLNAGSYYMLAHYGDSLATGFGKPYFQAKSPFEISADQRHVNVSGTAKLHNVKIAVKYGEDLLRDYPDFLITFVSDKEGAKGKLSYTKSETREGFIPAGNLTFTLFRDRNDLDQDADENGNIKVAAFTKTITAEPNDFITLTVNTKPAEGKLTVGIEIDKETENITEEVEISSTYVSTAAPVITLADDLKSALEFFEGDDLTGAVVSIRSTAGYSHVYLDFMSSYLESKGLTSGIDFMDMDENTASVVKGLGITATEMGPEVKFAAVDFSGVSRNLKYEAVPFDAEFKVRVVDNNGNEVTSDPFSLRIKKWNSSVNVSEVNAFARSFRGVTMTSEDGDASKFALQYRTGDGEWTTVKPEAVDGNTLSFAKISGLVPETAYQFRPVYNGSESLVDKDYVTVTTEAAVQVGNAGFEDWYSERVYDSDKNFNYPVDSWWPKASKNATGLWATRNDLTTSYRESVANYYTTYPGTVKTTDAHSGTAAAEISTVGWGKANTFTEVGGKVYNKTAGTLFIGDFADGKEVYGKEFQSRPDAFEFYYKFTPYNNESFKAYIVVENREGIVTTELGRGEVVSNNRENGYVKQRVDIQYVDINKVPTHMYIVFLSSNAESPEVGAVLGKKGAFSGYKDSRYIGSVLKVDDIELIYE